MDLAWIYNKNGISTAQGRSALRKDTAIENQDR